jgi:hypothetical protein
MIRVSEGGRGKFKPAAVQNRSSKESVIVSRASYITVMMDVNPTDTIS